MISLLLAFAVALLLTGWMVSDRSAFAIMDHPNERSLHERPTPRSGGIAILLAVTAGWSWRLSETGIPGSFGWVAIAALVVAAVSFLDDLFELSAKYRFPVHILAASLIISGVYALPSGWFGMAVTLLGVVWMLNLFNFMDGMDGFAGGMTVAGFGFLGFAGWLGNNETYALFCWTVTFAALGFLVFNFPPARIFMGDTGSATLGLLAAALALWGMKLGLFGIEFPLLVFSPFIVDATVTLIRRALRGERVWQAHREHYYQRLVRSGWGHRKTVLAEYALMLMVGTSALIGLQYNHGEFAVLLFWAIFYIGLMLFAEWHIIKGEPQ